MSPDFLELSRFCEKYSLHQAILLWSQEQDQLVEIPKRQDGTQSFTHPFNSLIWVGYAQKLSSRTTKMSIFTDSCFKCKDESAPNC